MYTGVSSDVVELGETIATLKEELHHNHLIALDQFTKDIKYIQELFKKQDIKGYEYSWSTIVSDHIELVSSIVWDDKRDKIMYCFSEYENPSILLGESLEVRLACLRYFKAFLRQGVALYSDLLNGCLN